VIAEQSREGWFRSRILAGLFSGTTPALRATPPDSGGEPLASILPLRTFHSRAPTSGQRSIERCKAVDPSRCSCPAVSCNLNW
jgi:hypothetical protein